MYWHKDVEVFLSAYNLKSFLQCITTFQSCSGFGGNFTLILVHSEITRAFMDNRSGNKHMYGKNQHTLDDQINYLSL